MVECRSGGVTERRREPSIAPPPGLPSPTSHPRSAAPARTRPDRGGIRTAPGVRGPGSWGGGRRAGGGGRVFDRRRVGAIGRGRDAVGDGRSVMGRGPAVARNPFAVIGDGREVTADGCEVIGAGSPVIGDGSLVVGDRSPVIGNASPAVGDPSFAIGEGPPVIGEGLPVADEGCPMTAHGFLAAATGDSGRINGANPAHPPGSAGDPYPGAGHHRNRGGALDSSPDEIDTHPDPER